jgi:galactitol-specific phosphotransferase system IIB component
MLGGNEMKNGIKCVILRSGDFFSHSVEEKIKKVGKEHNMAFDSEKLVGGTIKDLCDRYDVIMIEQDLNSHYLDIYNQMNHSKAKLFQLAKDDLMVSKVDKMINRLISEIENV